MFLIDYKHKKMENEVLSYADAVLTVSSSWAIDFKCMGAKKTFVLTNGYDLEDYQYTFHLVLVYIFDYDY